jgi:Zn finger protein HypA/HybF involved in hydrogenase expression
MKPMTLALAAGIAIGAGLLVGCGSSQKTDAEDGMAMMCPKCETVWVRQTVGNNPRVQRYQTQREMVCADCDKMAMAYLDGDQVVLHECPMCKATPVAVRSDTHKLQKPRP